MWFHKWRYYSISPEMLSTSPHGAGRRRLRPLPAGKFHSAAGILQKSVKELRRKSPDPVLLIVVEIQPARDDRPGIIFSSRNLLIREIIRKPDLVMRLVGIRSLPEQLLYRNRENPGHLRFRKGILIALQYPGIGINVPSIGSGNQILRLNTADLLRPDKQFLLRLPDGGIRRFFARLHPSAGKADLSALCNSRISHFKEYVPLSPYLQEGNQYGCSFSGRRNPNRRIVSAQCISSWFASGLPALDGFCKVKNFTSTFSAVKVPMALRCCTAPVPLFTKKKGCRFPDSLNLRPDVKHLCLIHLNDLLLVVCSAVLADSVRHHKSAALAASYQSRSRHFPVRSSLISMRFR